MGSVHVVSHPLVQDKLSVMRSADTSVADFRRLLHETTLLLAYELTRDLPMREIAVSTPVAEGTFPALEERPITIVPILRAGLGMVDALLELMPGARVGHIGLARDEKTHEPVEYYCNMPQDVARSFVMLVDPMLATGGSARDALRILKRQGCEHLRMLNLLAAPEGIEAVQQAHPDVDIYVAAIDDGLNERSYIVPGLGDAGDRVFGTL